VFSKSKKASEGFASLAAIGVFAAFGVYAANPGDQTNPSGPGATPTLTADPNCAVSTARIGSVDVTEFFGIRGGASGFAQNFGASSSPASTTTPTDPTLVQRCIRLEVDNPAPSDLLPVGGYVMTGFAFDPTAGSNALQGGSGIASVEVFLDDPNQGGSIVGQATTDSATTPGKGLGIASARGAAFGEQFASSGFRLTVQIPSSAAGNQHALFVLAQSSAGRVGTIAVPVIVGNLTPAVPTRTP
jgi:hypothetical protein